MKIFWDITKTHKNKVYSGLNRVSAKLCDSLIELGHEVQPVTWKKKAQTFFPMDDKKAAIPKKGDFFITPELFCDNERPGAHEWLKHCKAKTVAIFHDAIPLKYPEFTWPKSVARHPFYLKELAFFDLVLANSCYSRQELTRYWNWLELTQTPPVAAIPLGADFKGTLRVLDNTPGEGALKMLMIGILEPRKNQQTVLEAVEILHQKKRSFQLSLVGRTNPHFGKPIVKTIERLKKEGVPVHFYQQIPDAELIQLYKETDITIFPSRTEGNGLPIIESIWNGKPPIVSPIPPHMEHAKGGGGMIVVDPMTPENLAIKLEELIVNRKKLEKLTQAAHQHVVPTWDESAKALADTLTNHA